MSRLDELIAKFCPNGVKYRELKDILIIKNGKDYKNLTEGKYPVYGSGGIMTYVSSYVYDKPSVLIPRKGSIDKLYYVEEPFWNVDTIFYTEIDEEKVIETDTLIIATGASAKYLGLPDEHKYAGMGVSACATCDGFFYRKKTVAVVGGGDTACEEAIYLAGLAKQVYLIVRKPYLRASKVMQERVFKTPNITVLFEHNTLGLFGENGVEGTHLVKRMGEPDEEKVDIAIDGFFLAIGHKPNSDIFKPWVDTDEVGYIVTVPGTPRTKVPGVFAAGDVADPHYRQAITAAGSGCKAAIEAERYLSEIGK